jgi:hypothetical protein
VEEEHVERKKGRKKRKNMKQEGGGMGNKRNN